MRYSGATMDQHAYNWIGHSISIISILVTMAGLLPALAAFVAVVWYMIQIYESATFQKWLDTRRALRKARRIAKLRAEQRVLLAELEGLEVIREARAIADDKVASAAADAKVLLSNAATHEKVAKS